MNDDEHKYINNERLLADGFGNCWSKCALKQHCELEIVRPGKAQCNKCDNDSTNNIMIPETILVISGKVVKKNSKIDWPDLNYPGTGQTILRVVHDIDHVALKLQLDSENGPWFDNTNLPEGVGFFERCK